MKFSDSLRGYAYSVHKRDAFVCQYCGLDGTLSLAAWLSLSIDHLLPKSHPMRDSIEYIVTACQFCNCADNRFFEQADKRGLVFENLTRNELIAQRRPFVERSRTSYGEFWLTNVKTDHELLSPKQLLVYLGFKPAGHWDFTAELLTAKLNNDATKTSLLYAFVSNETVLYIGKSVKTLSARMRGYARPGITQRTNISNNANLKLALSGGAAVDIWVFAPTEQIGYRGLPISIAAGLEDILIDRVKPEWNTVGTRLKG